jgi:hypothetical protein
MAERINYFYLSQLWQEQFASFNNFTRALLVHTAQCVCGI